MASKLIVLNPDAGEQTKTQIVAVLTGAYHSLNGMLTNYKNWVWENRTGLTPQEVANLFGTDASELIDAGDKLVAVLNNLTGESFVESFVPADKTAAVEVDGTITITDKAVIEK